MIEKKDGYECSCSIIVSEVSVVTAIEQVSRLLIMRSFQILFCTLCHFFLSVLVLLSTNVEVRIPMKVLPVAGCPPHHDFTAVLVIFNRRPQRMNEKNEDSQ